MSRRKIRVGIVGAGGNTRKMHLPGLQRIPGVDVVLVCNRSEGSSRSVASDFKVPRIATDWREVIADPEVDAVLIGTWPYLHAEVTIAALEAGKHVLTEARMSRNLEEARAMLEATRRRPDLVAQIVPAPMSLDFDSTIQQFLRREEWGELREVCVTHTGSQFLSAASPITWRQDAELSGFNVLSMGIYHEMVQRWLGREAEWVMADAAVFTRKRPGPDDQAVEVRVPDSISILGRFGPGERLVYHFSGVEAGPARNEIRLNFERGGLRFDVGANRLYRSDLSGETEVVVPAEERRGWRVEEDFVASIRDGRPVTLTSFEDGVRYMRFTEAVHRAWIGGNRQILARL